MKTTALPAFQKCKRAIYQTGEDALDLETAASKFGFNNVDEMITAFVGMKALGRRANIFIRSETNKIMQDRHGDDPRKDGAAERLAVAATHNNDRMPFLEQEVNLLVRETGSREVSDLVLKEAARKSLAGLAVKNASAIQRYMQAERKAARRSEVAIRDGNYLEALNQKEIQLFNYHLVDEAKRVSDEFYQGIEYLKKISQVKPDKSDISEEYLQQVKVLLSVYGIGSKKYKNGQAINLLKVHNSWVALQQREDGLLYQPPSPMITNSEVKRIRDMTLSEFRGLVDMVKNMEQVGKGLAKMNKAVP